MKTLQALLILLALLAASYLLVTLATYVIIELLGIALHTTLDVNIWAAGGIAWIVLAALTGKATSN